MASNSKLCNHEYKLMKTVVKPGMTAKEYAVFYCEKCVKIEYRELKPK